MNKIVEMKDVSKKYQEKTVIDIENLILEKGKIYGFIGKNGVGKTTLFKLITGLKKQTEGTIKIFGKDNLTYGQAVLNKFGINIDSPRFYNHLTAEENISLHLQYMNVEKYLCKIREILESVGLDISNELPVAKYSLGMKQRLAIARAISHNPEILVLDEPMNGLDPTGANDIRLLLIKLAQEQGKTILISSHIISDLMQFIDQAIILKTGKIHINESLETLKNIYGKDLEYKLIYEMEGK